ncbi:helix-turn-helix domain-containing protein [Celeribacter halophilus]|uniref:helix-turn-helix domain-containing protein n=1 Tax=Celeribacter halophilus TaxID=576117 RepID=UPI003A915DE1
MPTKKGPEYEQTQRLINIAIKSGLTQQEIAKLCRVDQSTVSRWKKGQSRARLDQIKPLLKRFSDRMERPPFQLYQRNIPEGCAPSTSMFLKVEGRLLLREAFEKEPQSKDRPEAVRISVQEVTKGRFALVVERACGPLPRSRDKYNAVNLRSRDMPWYLQEEGHALLVDQERLIRITITFHEWCKKNWNSEFSGLERLGLLTTLALMKHGYIVDGLETLTDANAEVEQA